jgi:hypothetical protein
MNCLSPTPCGHFNDGCNYAGKCVNKSDYAPPAPPAVDQAKIDAKQQVIRNNSTRYWTDKGIFYADMETRCPDHGCPTVPTAAGLWPCPECLRADRNGTLKTHEPSKPYHDDPEPPEITDEAPF